MLWLQRWNFIERARRERELWDAFERGEDLEALLESCRCRAEASEPGEAFRLEVWSTTLGRIRKIERLMAGQSPPRPDGQVAADPNPTAGQGPER